MADATSLPALKEKWKIPEKPLSRSFRCNNQIAHGVRNISGNADFVGCGDDQTGHQRPFIIRESSRSFATSVSEFQRALKRAGVDEAASAILCRGHEQLESIRGEVNYTNFQGLTKEFAQASFFRDCRKDYKRAFQIAQTSLRSIAEDSDLWVRIDENPENEEAQRVKLAIWRFVKSDSGLPAVSLTGTEWISRIRTNLGKLLLDIGINDVPKLGQKIRKTGLEDNQMGLPLFAAQTLFPPIRQETIHHVKGESINGVLVLGSTKFFNTVVDSISSGVSSEERRLAYVAMTRARHLLVVGLPAAHFDKHSDKWTGWGFNLL